MSSEKLALEEIPGFIMQNLRNKSKVEKKEFIKQFIILMLRRKQRFSESIRNFEFVFKIGLPRHIKEILLAEKELFDNHQKYDAERIEQLSIFFVQKSPICEDSIINVNLNSTKRIIGVVLN